MKKWNQKWTMPARVLLAGAGIAAAAMLVPMVVSALAPPAGALIGNQAFADYKDSSGTALRVKSNEISTTVAQVGGVLLSNNGDKTAAAGNTVSMPHTLTNSGNGTDSFLITAVDAVNPKTFSNIAIYADNGNGGQTGQPLCATPVVSGSPIPSCTAGFTQSVGGNNGTFNFVVAYTIPSNATTPLSPAAYDTATVTAAPVANAAIPYPSTLATDDTKTDTVRLTTGAAFASQKTIGAPAVAAPSGSWPTAVSAGNASTSTTCSTTWSSTLGTAPAAGCTYTVYTISFNNTGGAAGTYSMSDTLGLAGTTNVGLTYVAGSAVWSGNGGLALDESGNTPLTVGSSVVTTKFAANKFTATVTNVAPNTSGTISFAVLVNSLAVAGKSKTTNTALYGTTNCAAPDCTTQPTNDSWFTVSFTYKVIAANAVNATTFDSAPGAPSQTKPGVDVVEPVGTTNGNAGTSTAYLGSKVYFADYVINKSNVSDTFNVSIPAAAVGTTGNNTFPVGTTFAYYTTTDGIHPSGLLLDTNGDSIFDTGPLDPNASFAILVEATLPPTGTLPAGAVYALLTATSVGAGSTTPVVDSVWNEIDSIKSGKVDLTNTANGNMTDVNGTQVACTTTSLNCDLGQGPSQNPTFTESTTPGVPVSFPIYIKNQDTASTSYTLTDPTLPSGWTVKFVPSTGTCASDAVTQPVSVAAGAQVEVLACVTPPAGTIPGKTNIQITATSTTDPTVKDSILDAVQVNAAVVPRMVVGPITDTVTTAPGGTAVIPVTIGNTGNTSCGANDGFNVSVTLDAASAAAFWNVAVYYDGGSTLGAIDTGDTLIDLALTAANLTSPASLVPLLPAPGNVKGIPLLVKLIAPVGATVGSTATATLTVKDMNRSPTTAVPVCPPATGTYTDNVTNGQLNVLKTQQVVARVAVSGSNPVTYTCDGTLAVATSFSAASVKVNPGDCIAYQVVTTNMGNANVTNVMLTDAIPAYTAYNTTQPATKCAATLNSGVPSFIQTGSGATTTAVACGLTTGTGVTLQPNGTMTLFYVVEVQQ